MSQGDTWRARRNSNRDRKKWGDKQRKRRRELGQNFLKDKRIARQIVEEAEVEEDDLVVELGSGGGMLTRQLARRARQVVAIEYDPYWVNHLKERFLDDEHVRIVHDDALRAKLPKEPFRVVANVPFYITTSILHRLLDDPTAPPETVHLLVQKHVALKHARSSPTTLKTLNWSPWYRFRAGFELSGDAFHPKPEVDACLMVATKRDVPLVDSHHRHLFRALVHLAFNGRGNTAGTVLRLIFTKTQLHRLAEDNGFSPDFPSSTLTVHQWASVFDFMLLVVPRDRWPSARRQAKRERRRC